MKQMHVYIMANRFQTLYVGVTNDVARRVWHHKHMEIDGFTRRYLKDKLVYYEPAPDAPTAIRREKQIKGWVRRRKVSLIESVNPEGRDLSLDFLDIRPDVSSSAGHEPKRSRRDSSLLMASVNTAFNPKQQRRDPSLRGAQNDKGGGA